jgi:hypothetical protein
MARERARFLRSDPYLNAAQRRYGYALTLHRAQGQHFDTVIADLDTGQGLSNEPYFRWLYTLFTVIGHRLVMFNTPEITLLSRARWDDRFARVAPVKPRGLVPYDPYAEEDSATPGSDSLTEPALRNLYRHIGTVMAPLQIRVAPPVCLDYQQVYTFEADAGGSCVLRFYYNGRFQVTKIETERASPEGLADQIRRALVAGLRFENPFQRTLHNLVAEKLHQGDISVDGIEHHRYKETYFLKSADGDLKLDIDYNRAGFVTRVAPMEYSAPEVLDAVKRALGLRL